MTFTPGARSAGAITVMPPAGNVGAADTAAQACEFPVQTVMSGSVIMSGSLLCHNSRVQVGHHG